MSKVRAEAVPTTVCRECYKRIPVDAKFCPDCGKSVKAPAAVPVILVVLLLASSVFLISSSVVTAKRVLEVSDTDPLKPVAAPASVTPAVAEPVVPKDITKAAYDAVRQLAQQKYPNAQRISDLPQSPVTKVGEGYVVTLYVDSVENGSAVRNVLQVKVQLESGKWVQKELIQ